MVESRPRARRRQGLRRPARRQARRARSAHRRGRVVDAGGALAGRLLDHGGAALLRRPRDHGVRGRRSCVARPPEGIQRPRRIAQVDVLHDARTRRAGPRDLAAGQRRLEVRRRIDLADARRRPGARAHLLLDEQSGPRPERRACARATISTPLSIVAIEAADGTLPLALPRGASRPLGLRRAESRRAVRRADHGPRRARASPRSARPASRTSSIARTASR